LLTYLRQAIISAYGLAALRLPKACLI